LSSSASRTRRPVAGERARARTTSTSAGARTVTLSGGRPRLPSLPSGSSLPGLPSLRGLGTRHTSASVGAVASGRRRWVAPVVALVAVLAVLGTVVGVGLRDPGAQARTDRAAASQARTSIEQMLSYNYKTIDAQAAQIEGLLTGSFKGEFSTAMDKDIKPLAVKNQTVVQARVSDIGVMSSSPTTVKVLAFVNQARVGTDQVDPVVDQNRVIATMSRVDGRWLISKVEAF
jgi:Mce-associated membrane protein